ncbi:MAG: hypothetical protein M1817_006688 [Caeruleum heppii]|nr:MAG: hypothetical protein M1817_006688 [Caeruleum heppii]
MAEDVGTNGSEEPSLADPVEGRPISHGQLLELSRRLQLHSSDHARQTSLEDLLRGSKVHAAPKQPKKEKTSEYETLMAQLRRDEEVRAYQRMLHPPLQPETFAQRFPSSPHAHMMPSIISDEDEDTYADVNRQMAVIINILVSIIACSVAIWMATSHWSIPRRLGLSMGGSGVVAVAEVVVYNSYIRRVHEAKKTERARVETKEIINTWIIGGGGKIQGKAPHSNSNKLDGVGGVRKRTNHET